VRILSLKTTSSPFDKIIRFDAKRAYLLQNASLLTIMTGGQSVYEWIYIEHTREQNASIEANTPPKCRICIKNFSISLRTSNIWYQTWRSNGQHVWFIFWRLGVQTSSSRYIIIALKNMSVEAGLDSLLPRVSIITETALFNKPLNVCCSCSLLACGLLSWADKYKCYGDICCLHFQGWMLC
jgi:hypothetical protein